jgi:hypothetical protein
MNERRSPLQRKLAAQGRLEVPEFQSASDRQWAETSQRYAVAGLQRRSCNRSGEMAPCSQRRARERKKEELMEVKGGRKRRRSNASAIRPQGLFSR